MKQTAVEWFAEELNKWRTANIGEHSTIGIPSEVLDKAKEMEKEQAERMYSEEEVYNLLEEAMKDCYNQELEYHYDGDYKNLKEWFEQFKKK